MKKIDDDILHKMISDGKPQREMARLFGVSDAAISKRIKRLHQAEPPESFKSLTSKEQKFVLAKLEGKSGTAAALQAYDCGSVESAKTIGSRLSGDPDISQAIHDLMHQEGIGRRYRVKRLRDVINAADLGIASKGLDMANKLTGEYAPEKIDVNGQMAAVHMLIAEIQKADREVKDCKNLTVLENPDL
ncbi:MAG: hypothetical protein Q7U03_02275 [Syntrophales bacterium]|nr:hypothetical protein [Syntrophales bacterium]